MTRVSLIKPLDQPLGIRRLLHDLNTCLASELFFDFKLIVSYAKSGPLLRLENSLREWRDLKKTSSAIIGIDQKGTSLEALDLCLHLFDQVYITQETGITFHPKIYLFKGITVARTFIGSNNLTVGGTEKNFESSIDIEFSLPKDENNFLMIEQAWTDLLPSNCPATKELDNAFLNELISDGRVIKEGNMRSRDNGDASMMIADQVTKTKRSGLLVKPESPLPKPKNSTTETSTPVEGTDSSPVRGLVIQIKPHNNGEIFLSVSAALQKPAFFKWPFTGRTVPKRPGNPSYPQREPDPVIDLDVFGSSSQPLLTLRDYALNTVFYERKSELRITASPLVEVVPEYSVMIIEQSGRSNVDYEITIHTPDSPDYSSWVDSCNQTMPGGGKKPRKFGWF